MIKELEQIHIQFKRVDDDKRNHIIALYTIFSIFFAGNAILLQALFQNQKLEITLNQWIIVAFFGLVMSIVWYIFQYRVLSNLKFLEKLSFDIEKELSHFSPIYIKFSAGRDNQNFSSSNKGFRMTPLLYAVPILVACFWSIILGYPFGFGFAGLLVIIEFFLYLKLSSMIVEDCEPIKSWIMKIFDWHSNQLSYTFLIWDPKG